MLVALVIAFVTSLVGFMVENVVDANEFLRVVETFDSSTSKRSVGIGMNRDSADAFTRTLAAIGAFIGFLKVIEWILIALTRQYGDALTVVASELIGVPPDDVLNEPRVCLDVRWLWSKLKRRITGAVGFVVTTAPAILFLGLVLSPLIVFVVRNRTDDGAIVVAWFTNALGDLFITIMLFGWIGVFTLGKTGHAWKNPSAPDLVFVRHASSLGAFLMPRLPRIAGIARLYERVIRRITGFMRSPAQCVGRAPWETVGLVMARVFFSIPGLYIIGRPIIPVTSAVVLAARAPDVFAALPVHVQLREAEGNGSTPQTAQPGVSGPAPRTRS